MAEGYASPATTLKQRFISLADGEQPHSVTQAMSEGWGDVPFDRLAPDRRGGLCQV